MTNEDIADKLKWYADLSELHQANTFKIKSYANAAYKIDKLPSPLADKSLSELEKIEGIGTSIGGKVVQLLETGSFDELDELLALTPDGVQQLFSIKGIGPKKIAFIWKELGIESPGELLYACNENRLAEAKGFGIKTQESIKKSIEFMFSNANKFHYAQLELLSTQILQDLSTTSAAHAVAPVGALARKVEILEQLEYIVATELAIDELASLLAALFKSEMNIKLDTITTVFNQHIPVHFKVVLPSRFSYEQFLAESSELHLQQLTQLIPDLFTQEPQSAEEIYSKAGLPFIPVEMREGMREIELASANKIPTLLELGDLKGILHNHTTYSDGINTLTEMAVACKSSGFQYLGICDHSKSAFYAKGLKEETILQQHAEIDKLNEQLAPFKIFKGIESDILNDGALDYAPEVLASFDFIVASIHSNLKMTEEKAMHRLIKAIENPYTTILGHPTGRLLLMREGYPVDHKKMIDACAANGVVIEINAHPFRLDLDWRYIDYALSKGVKLSINPDAHRTEGYLDMKYGVYIARKGGLSKDMCFNALNLQEISTYFNQRKPK
ncbi:MAG: helix-hairpin-helix domain-containing protein [Bacteroidia bacterium]|jgi:DNA polymerase (family 10)|nr:helix-hairpin-helix domain-containing protein [Bacteroidia bacterium]